MKKQISNSKHGFRGKRRFSIHLKNLVTGLAVNKLQALVKRTASRQVSSSPDPAAAVKSIGDNGAALTSVSQSVEPQFIKMGEELQAVFFEATGLTRQITQNAELFGTNSERSLLVKLRQRVETSLEELRDFRRKVFRDTDHIRSIIEHLGHLYHHCEKFEQTTMFIRVVGLNIGVESTRSTESSEMFSVVSGEIKKVSERITEITKAILEDAKAEQVRQASTSAEIFEGMTRLNTLAEEGEQAVRHAVENIEHLTSIALKTLEDATQHATEISRQVGEIVQAIQFHDNMNQRIEHIVSGFADVEILWNRAAEDTCLEDEKAQCRGKAYLIMDIQQAQLERVISEVDRVHQKSRQAFEKIKTAIEELANTLPAFDSVGQKHDDDGKSVPTDPIAALQKALDALCDIQEKGRHLVERVDSSTHQASEKAVTLSDHTRDVRRISLETHLMALNAVVKAAHLGESGRTHEVLAQEMRRLSKRSEMFVEDVETIIEQINRSARDLTAERDQSAGEACDSPLDISLPMDGEEVTGTYAGFAESAAVILKRTEALNTEISRTSDKLEFLPLLSDELGRHLKEAKEICQILSPWAAAYQENEDDRATALVGRYTMAEERVVHDRALRLEDDNLELFAEDPSKCVPPQSPADSGSPFESLSDPTPGEEDLGGNVELF